MIYTRATSNSELVITEFCVLGQGEDHEFGPENFHLCRLFYSGSSLVSDGLARLVLRATAKGSVFSTMPPTTIPAIRRVCGTNCGKSRSTMVQWAKDYGVSQQSRKDLVMISSSMGQPLVRGVLDGMKDAINQNADQVDPQDFQHVLDWIVYLARTVENGFPDEDMVRRIMLRVADIESEVGVSNHWHDDTREETLSMGSTSQENNDNLHKGGTYYPGHPPLSKRGVYFKDLESIRKTGGKSGTRTDSGSASDSAWYKRGCDKRFSSKDKRTGGIFTFMWVTLPCLS